MMLVVNPKHERVEVNRADGTARLSERRLEELDRFLHLLDSRLQECNQCRRNSIKTTDDFIHTIWVCCKLLDGRLMDEYLTGIRKNLEFINSIAKETFLDEQLTLLRHGRLGLIDGLKHCFTCLCRDAVQSQFGDCNGVSD